jgi:ergothioneine biosynthesis protein EgtB
MSAEQQRSDLARDFARVRALTERLMAPLSPEDFRCQSMPDVSPPYWNLGHTSWFFQAQVLAPHGCVLPGFDGFDYAFNSYYEGLGPRLPRPQRGQVAQPATAAVREYRAAVDAAVLALLENCSAAELPAIAGTLAVGIQHEQQHQELFLTEILHIRWSAPAALREPYAPAPLPRAERAGETPLRPIACRGGTVLQGHQEAGFCWDNELPAHRVTVGDFVLGDRLITNAEWCAFVDDGGYRRPLLWLSNGWLAVQQHGWQAPLYWQRDGGAWRRFTLRGLVDLEPQAPVCHVSFYEADAFARWYGEQFFDWRHARLHGLATARANLLDDDLVRSALDVLPAPPGSGLRQLAGDGWEWTMSHYEAYPGYRPFPGALMEYNGKFMDNQRVLRGGSFATPRSQARACYRNFWPPDTRFQATGVRLTVDR